VKGETWELALSRDWDQGVHTAGVSVRLETGLDNSYVNKPKRRQVNYEKLHHTGEGSIKSLFLCTVTQWGGIKM